MSRGTRAPSLNLDTATDTEYGALKTKTVICWNWQEGGNGSTGNKTKLLWANISVAAPPLVRQTSSKISSLAMPAV